MIVQISLGMKVSLQRFWKAVPQNLNLWGVVPFFTSPFRTICKKLIIRYIWNTCQKSLFGGRQLNSIDSLKNTLHWFPEHLFRYLRVQSKIAFSGFSNHCFYRLEKITSVHSKSFYLVLSFSHIWRYLEMYFRLIFKQKILCNIRRNRSVGTIWG